METINFGEPQASQEEKNQNENSAPKAPNGEPKQNWRKNKKLIWAGIILAALILAVLGWQYWQYTHSVYYQQMKAVKMIEAQQKESDKWGGKTPEETVRLFTEAVKKGDFDLASKYGNRELIMPVLEKMKAEGKISDLIKWLEAGEIDMFDNGYNADLIIRENKQDFWIMGLFRSDGGTWKIVEF